MSPSGYIELSDIYLAYKKVKVEAYYDSSHPSCIKFTEFEENLGENIEVLYEMLNSGSASWWSDPGRIGEFLYIPKSIDDHVWNKVDNVHYRSVDPNIDWQQRFRQSGNERIEAKYRLIIVPTVEYQIISTLWILKVGHVLEACVNRKLSYGNLIRRKANLIGSEGAGQVNLDSQGIFVPYFSAYQDWRNRGLNAMRSLLDDGKNVTAITMDLTSFYHNVCLLYTSDAADE